MKNVNIALSALALFSASFGTVQAAQGPLSQRDAVVRSYEKLQERAASYGIVDAREELKVRSVWQDQLKHTHVRMDQYYRGIPVFGDQLVTHFNNRGEMHYVSGSFSPVMDVDMKARLSSLQALRIAEADFGQGVSVEPTVKLVVLAWEMDEPQLAYQIRLTDIDSDSPKAWMYFVSARTGEIIMDWDDLHHAAAQGTAQTMYVGSVDITTDSGVNGFQMKDPSRGGIYTTDMNNTTSGNGQIFVDADNAWGNGNNADRATAGGEVHFGVSATWDYYKNVHGRNGIKDNGQGSLSRVHYGIAYVNAFWDDSCFCMTYGDGDGVNASPLTTIDVSAHEMTHGVTSNTAGLIYSKQPGALNESMSDIFGTAVEFYAVTEGAQTQAEYWVGEDCWTPAKPGDALRYMDDPTKDGYSIDNAKRYKAFMDVHYTSGVSNNVFYLASEGGKNKTSGMSVVGIGRDKVEKIFYRALSTYMTPTTNWSSAKSYTVQAAKELYGQAEADAITQAWAACGV